jgi:hypothetical protein
MIARVTKESIEHFSSKGKSIKDIEATAKSAAIESDQCLCVPSKTATNSSNPQSIVAANHANIDNYLESSSEYSFSSEEKDPPKTRKPRTIYIAKKHVSVLHRLELLSMITPAKTNKDLLLTCVSSFSMITQHFYCLESYQ